MFHNDSTGKVDSGVIAVTTAWTLICNLNVNKLEDWSGLLLQNTGAAALTNLELRRALSSGGYHLAILTDTDFNTATLECRNAVPSNIHLLGAGAAGQIIINNEGVAEYSLWAKSAGTNIQVTGMVGNPEQ